MMRKIARTVRMTYEYARCVVYVVLFLWPLWWALGISMGWN